MEDEEEEGKEEGEEEEQRPLCSGVLGYPVVRDHALGLRTKEAADAQARDDVQDQPFKGEPAPAGPAGTQAGPVRQDASC